MSEFDPEPAEAAPDPDLEILLALIRDSRGFDFTAYKRPSLSRRIRKRMQAVGLDSFGDYARKLEAEPDEFIHLFNTILINVTELMRDRDAWEYLEREILVDLAQREREQIRVWSAGCATGEEAYTLAVLLVSVLGEERYSQVVKIYATDADEDALRHARIARFPLAALVDAFGEDRAHAYFERSDSGYSLRTDLRRAIVFGRHDLVQDPPISRVDLLVSRNTLMYFNADVQRRILNNFYFALNDEGYLFLGKSEALVTRTNLFAAVDQRRHVFRKHVRTPLLRSAMAQPPVEGTAPIADASVVVEAAYDAGLPAQLTVDLTGTVVAANRQARAVLGIGIAQVGRPLRDLDISYRPVELRGPIEQAINGRRSISINDVEHRTAAGDLVYFDIVVAPVERAGALLGALATFSDITASRQVRYELDRSQRELEIAYEELQSTVEELETTNEELQSTNEELETTNEELHSTNEELETMNEELQSTNEELETVNSELRTRTQELDGANHFLESILSSLHAGVAVLDANLMVRAWNATAQDLWGLRREEVLGHHFLNLDFGLPVDELRQPIREVLSSGSGSHRRVVRAVNRRGREISCEIVIGPICADERPAGAIVLMEDGTVERD